MIKLAAVAVMAVAASACAADADDLWFFADFDSTPVLDGEALLDPLPEEEMVEGRFGRACAFRSHFWKVSDPVRLRDFPREAGSFSCFFRSEEASLTNSAMNVVAYCGFWTYNWGWGDGSFRTSGKVPGMVQFRYLKGGSPVKRKLEWQHFAATWNREVLAVYLDGKKFAEKKNPQIDDIRGCRAEKFVVGSFGDGRKATNLVLDDVAVFRRVLSADEVRALAAGAKRPRASSPDLLASPVNFKTFYRDDDNAALRCRIVAESEELLRMTGEVGGRPVPAQEVRTKKGDVPLVVKFNAGAYKAGRYPYAFRLTDASGRVRLERRGELVVKPRLNPKGFRYLCWGGYDPLTTNFLQLAGFTSANVGLSSMSATVPHIRRCADAGICPNIRYENYRADKGGKMDSASLEKKAIADLAPYEGVFPWVTTLVNSEVYGGVPKDPGIKNPPAEVNFKALGVPPPSGVVKDAPPQYEKLKRYFASEMPAYRYNAAAYRAIKKISPDNQVWSEPMFRGVSSEMDMTADWFYAYSTVNTLSEMRQSYASHRPFNKPFMPTLAMVYWHPLSKEGRAKKLAQTCDEVEIKSWMAAGAVRLDALSAYEADAWQRGLSPSNGLCEVDAAARYGRFFRERFLPAAELLKGLDCEREKVAVLAPSEVDFMAGFWWGRVHYRNAICRGLARDGMPFDVLEDDEITAERLKGCKFIVLPMGKMLMPERHAAILAAAKAGAVVVQDKYGAFDFPGGVRLADLEYKPSLVNAPNGMAKMYAPLGKMLAPHRAKLAADRTAHSSCDTTTNGFTFVKEGLGGVKYVVVVNDARRSGGCPQTSVFTNAWYKPMGAPQKIMTWFRVPAGGEVREFNPKPGDRRAVAEASRGGGEVSLTLDYGAAEARVFGIYPRRGTSVSIGASGRPVRGGRAVAIISVEDSAGPVADRRVLRVTVTDPEGNVNDASGLYVTKDGTAEVVMRFAEDDQEGSLFKRWHIVAEDLSSGETCSASWRLKR
ncbi:MAG: hypothetical protein IJG84_07025 [Kiritimatiellae bacterium]|nr:hypothetical protein [Kiritimatiellia bacterium]